MQNPARLFHCARCRCQVVICSHCDRGQIYCGAECSQQARRASTRAAGRRYQHSRRGRLRHAERQRRYRRRNQKVTHQGSPPGALDASLELDAEETAPFSEPVAGAVTPGAGRRCRFCARLCSVFVRLDFMRRRSHCVSIRTLDTDVPP